MPNKTLTPEQLDREIAIYLADGKADGSFLRFYRDLFLLQRRYSRQIKQDCPGSREQLQQRFREGRYLLSGKAPHIDPVLFRQVLGQVVEIFVAAFPQAEPLRKILDLPGLTENLLPQILASGKLLEKGVLEKQLYAWGWRDEKPLEISHVAGVVKDALIPFYLSYAAAVRAETDFVLWGEGRCPICGQNPGMAMLDREGARILECSFCRTGWYFPRLECPFCRNSDPRRLGYFYADNYPGTRVQFCECCKSYLKTAVVKEVGREVFLALEDIYTMDLDLLAQREGYSAGRDLALLR